MKEVDDPIIKKNDNILVRITSTFICASDFHLVHGMMPNFPKDYIIGHEQWEMSRRLVLINEGLKRR
ncbi:hypothetical protein [Salipaludibacillus daqingensis]|uniref:hypothetical protein n=1 Tax=Salipaludibacillus daqingensis TaxID=3041001 RepID=UPI003CC86CDC